MKASLFYFQTRKEVPESAEIISHQLMLRAGLIYRLAAGIYTYLPLGFRSLKKIENIVREEMLKAGATELLMPMVQPIELWEESGRAGAYGPELLKINDRQGRRFVLQPTAEEVITDLARQELKSYRQLPKNFFHIQTKFRDERRPRFGLMRGREFIMKDAYSFDIGREEALQSYQKMFDAYKAIFQRMGLTFRAVQADTGAIGGSLSHEFQVMAETGEDAIAYCPASDFAANIELAPAPAVLQKREKPKQPIEKIHTEGLSRCRDLSEKLGISLQNIVKAVVISLEGSSPSEALAQSAQAPDLSSEKTFPRLCLLLLRGDHELNETKVSKLPGLAGFRFAQANEIRQCFGCDPGYLGPVMKDVNIPVIADQTVSLMSDFLCGANQTGFHLKGVNWGRDLPEPTAIFDIRKVIEGDASPDGKGTLKIERGIEVGHVFYLGTKYSEKMGAQFTDKNGRLQLFEMGCYGIGVSRLLGATIEQHHDAAGIIWPKSIAPFEVVLVAIGYGKSEEVRSVSMSLYQSLLGNGVDVILDDRDERPGSAFADWELIGVPVRVTIGERGLQEGKIDVFVRRGAESVSTPIGQAHATVQRLLDEEGGKASFQSHLPLNP